MCGPVPGSARVVPVTVRLPDTIVTLMGVTTGPTSVRAIQSPPTLSRQRQETARSPLRRLATDVGVNRWLVDRHVVAAGAHVHDLDGAAEAPDGVGAEAAVGQALAGGVEQRRRDQQLVRL